MSYARPSYDAADASWSGAAAYTRPAYDAADASFTPDVWALRGQSASPLTAGQALAVRPPGVIGRSDGPLTAGQSILRSTLFAAGRSASPLTAGQAVLQVPGQPARGQSLSPLAVGRARLAAFVGTRTHLRLPSVVWEYEPCSARVSLPSVLPTVIRLVLPMAGTDPCVARCALPSAAQDSGLLSTRLALLASLLDGTITTLAPVPTLQHGGRTLIPLTVSLSADLGSPVWQADITLSDSTEYGPIRIGDALSLVIGDTTWSLLCDAKQRTRPAGYTIKALSTLARLGAPWARPQALGAVGLARAVCERLLGAVIDWSIPDWSLPSSAASLIETPLTLARLIVAAAGGVLESRPDGALIARPLYPLSPPTALGPVQAVLTDAVLFGHSETIGAPEIANRYTVTSGDTGSPVLIETVDDAGDPTHRTVRAYPSPWLDLTLAHTGDAAVQIGARSEVRLSKTDHLAIVAGQGSTSFPLEAITTQVYRYVDLGVLTVTGQAIKTAIAEYSQLDLTYTARAWQWEVYHPRVETIQFLAVEP